MIAVISDAFAIIYIRKAFVDSSGCYSIFLLCFFLTLQHLNYLYLALILNQLWQFLCRTTVAKPWVTISKDVLQHKHDFDFLSFL